MAPNHSCLIRKLVALGSRFHPENRGFLHLKSCQVGCRQKDIYCRRPQLPSAARRACSLWHVRRSCQGCPQGTLDHPGTVNAKLMVKIDRRRRFRVGVGMILKRLIVLCSVSLLTSGCSHMFRGPGQYASLRTSSRTDRATDVVIPGTLTAEVSGQRGRSVDPLTVLQHSTAASVNQQNLQPSGAIKPALAIDRSQRAAGLSATLEPTSTASLRTAEGTGPRSSTENYDRIATMNRILKRGQDVAQTICTAC